MAVEHVSCVLAMGLPMETDPFVISVSTLQAADQIVVRWAVQIPKRCASFQQLVRQFPIQGLAAAQDFEPIVALPARFSSSLHVAGVACITVAPSSPTARQPSSIRSHFPADQRQMRATLSGRTLQRRNIKRQGSNREQYILFTSPGSRRIDVKKLTTARCGICTPLDFPSTPKCRSRKPGC